MDFKVNLTCKEVKFENDSSSPEPTVTKQSKDISKTKHSMPKVEMLYPEIFVLEQHYCETNYVPTDIYLPFGGGIIQHRNSSCVRLKHTCGHCNSNFKSRNTLERHIINEHLKPFAFECITCGHECHEYIGRKSRISRRNSTCTCCYFQTLLLETYCVSLMYQCQLCDSSFSEQYMLYDHVKNHTELKENTTCYNVVHECSLCGFEMTSLKHLHSHMKTTHTIRQTYTCKLCSFETAHEWDLFQHLSERNGQCGYCCKNCGYTANGKIDLRKHGKLCSSQATDVSDNVSVLYVDQFTRNVASDGQKRYVCNLCGYRNDFRSLMKQHMFKHTGEKPYRCELCGYRTQRRNSLNVHMSKHTGHDKPFGCSLCSYRTLYKSNVSKHMLSHAEGKTDAAKYSCESCNFESFRKETWQRHMRVHTGEKPYACQFCGYRSSQKNLLTRHMDHHTGIKRHACHICDYKCSRKDSLNQHLARHNQRNLPGSLEEHQMCIITFVNIKF